MAAGFDNSASASAAATTSVTISSFAVGAGSDRLLVVSFGAEDSSGTDSVVSDVTFNGTSLTFKRRELAAAGQQIASEMWEYLAPPNVTADIVVTTDGTCTSLKANASSYTGIANQTAEATNGGDDFPVGGWQDDADITTVTDNALIVSTASAGADGTWTAGTNYTLGSSNSGDGASTADEYDLDAGTAATIAIDGAYDGGNNRGAYCALAYELAAVGGATTPKGPLGHPFYGPFGGPVG